MRQYIIQTLLTALCWALIVTIRGKIEWVEAVAMAASYAWIRVAV